MSTEPTSPAAKKNRLPAIIVAAGAAAGLTLAGFGISSAQTDSSTTTTPPAASSADQAPAANDAKPPMRNETALTGDTAEKVRAAALEAVPGGTVLRVETDDEGSPYEAHVRKADGNEVVVKVDAGFKVTSVDEFKGRGGHGPGDGTGPRGNETALTGDAAEKTRAAALEAVPGGTVLRVETDDEGSPYEAHVRKTDGTEVVVKLDAAFKVTSVDEFGGRGPGGPGGRHHDGDGPDESTTTDSPAATTTN